jgi:hypothetical protein
MDLENNDAQISGFIDRSETPIKERRKPGPDKKQNPRSVKISLRVTEGEHEEGLEFSRQHKISVSKILRAFYVALFTKSGINKLYQFSDTLAEALGTEDLPVERQVEIQSRLRAALKKHGLIFMIVLLAGGACAPALVKAYWFVYGKNNTLTYGDGDTCTYVAGRDGCLFEHHDK